MPNVAELTKDIEYYLEQIKLASGQEQVPIAKRATWRYRWVTPVTVEFINSKGSSESLYAATCSISAQGLDFRSPRMLERGCKVLICLESHDGQIQIPATVKHSTDSVGMPTVGVRFDL